MKLILPRLFLVFRTRPFTASCFVLAVVLAIGNYFLWQQHEVATRRHEEALHNGEFMVHALNGRSKVNADLATLSVGFQHIDENLVDERSMEVNLGYFYRFERMTHAHLVHLDQLSVTPQVAKARFKLVPFSLQLSGSYLSCMNFLRALENGPRILRIRNCDFERAGDTSSDLLLSLTVDALASP